MTFVQGAIPIICAVTMMAAVGCSTGYDMHLTNGIKVHSATKPKLDENGWYVYKEKSGEVKTVNSMRVRLIEPAE